MSVYIARDSLEYLRLYLVTDFSFWAERIRETILRLLGTSKAKLFELYDSFTDGKYEILAVYDPISAIHPHSPDAYQISPVRKLLGKKYIYMIRPMAILRATDDEVEKYAREHHIPVRIDYLNEPDYKPVLRQMMFARLDESAPSVVGEIEFLLLFKRTFRCNSDRDPQAINAIKPLVEWKERGIMVFDNGHHGIRDYIMMACQRVPPDVAETILQRMSGWAAMAAALYDT